MLWEHEGILWQRHGRRQLGLPGVALRHRRNLPARRGRGFAARAGRLSVRCPPRDRPPRHLDTARV